MKVFPPLVSAKLHIQRRKGGEIKNLIKDTKGKRIR